VLVGQDGVSIDSVLDFGGDEGAEDVLTESQLLHHSELLCWAQVVESLGDGSLELGVTEAHAHHQAAAGHADAGFSLLGESYVEEGWDAAEQEIEEPGQSCWLVYQDDDGSSEGCHDAVEELGYLVVLGMLRLEDLLHELTCCLFQRCLGVWSTQAHNYLQKIGRVLQEFNMLTCISSKKLLELGQDLAEEQFLIIRKAMDGQVFKHNEKVRKVAFIFDQLQQGQYGHLKALLVVCCHTDSSGDLD
jgi:hypothetical protein